MLEKAVQAAIYEKALKNHYKEQNSLLLLILTRFLVRGIKYAVQECLGSRVLLVEFYQIGAIFIY